MGTLGYANAPIPVWPGMDRQLSAVLDLMLPGSGRNWNSGEVVGVEHGAFKQQQQQQQGY